MKKVLITGISGFVGGFLTEHIARSGSENEIIGTYLIEPRVSFLDEMQQKPTLYQVDLIDQQKVNDLIKKTEPDVIYHLAALSSPAESFKTPAQTISNNINAQINLLEAVRDSGLTNTKILIVSSSEVYGVIDASDLPVDEATPLKPVSPYGVSKIAQDYLGLQYFNAYHMRIYRVRPFNHIGPGQSPHFVVSSFAKQVAEIEKRGKKPVFTVGNLHAKRDFTDVRDIVVAYKLILNHGKAGEVYNVGSGVSHSISEILDILLSLAKINITVEVDDALLRPGDVPEIVCDSKKIESLGWKPTISIEKSLSDTLEYWRNIL